MKLTVQFPWRWLLSLIILLALAGCRQQAAEPNGKTSPVARGPLKVLIVEEPGIAGEFGRRWAAENRFPIVVETISITELEKTGFVVNADVDLILLPAGIERGLIDARQLIPVSPEIVSGTGFSARNLRTYSHPDFSRINGVLYTLPAGKPDLMLLVRSGDQRGPQRIDSWNAVGGEGGEYPGKIAWPDEGNWLAWSLIARSASQIQGPEVPSLFFELADMKPLINSVPYVSALESMVQNGLPLDPEKPRGPAEIFATVARGDAVAGMGWPSLASAGEIRESGVFAVRLPGSNTRYSFQAGKWVAREPAEQAWFAVLPDTGCCVGMTTASLFANDAFSIATWISNDASSLVLPRSSQSGPFRLGHLENAERWVGESMSSEATELWVEELKEIDAGLLPVAFPALERRGEYLASLSEGVRSAMNGEKTPKEALDDVAVRWQELNVEAGIDTQRKRVKQSGR